MGAPKYWLHIGADAIKKEKFQSIRNIPFFQKPNGGLWASPLELNETYKSDWDRFSSIEFGRESYQKGVIFTFKKNTRIAVLDSQEDLINLFEEVGCVEKPSIFEWLSFLTDIFIDFEKACQYYDVIYLTKDGQARTRLPKQNQDYNLYGWDCESCLILNPNVIQEEMSVTI